MFDCSQEVPTTTSFHLPANCTPIELQEALHEANNAIRALSELVKSASLSWFDPQPLTRGSKAHRIAQDLQSGLGQLIDLCTERNERIIEGYVAQYEDSAAYKLKQAEQIADMASHGAFGKETVERLTDALSKTSAVLQGDGSLTDKTRAKAIETIILELMKKWQPAKSSKKKPATLADQRGEEVAS
nr:hypothetical protein [uncultured Desulfobulbus sp.]